MLGKVRMYSKPKGHLFLPFINHLHIHKKAFCRERVPNGKRTRKWIGIKQRIARANGDGAFAQCIFLFGFAL